MNQDVVESLLLHLSQSHHCISTYLSLLLRKSDPRKALFLLNSVDIVSNAAARFLVLLCQRDFVAAVILAQERPHLWSLLLAFLIAIKADNRIMLFAASSFSASRSYDNPQLSDTEELPYINAILTFIRFLSDDEISEDSLNGALDSWELYATLCAAFAPKATQFLVALGKRLVAAKTTVYQGHICFLFAGLLPGSVDNPSSVFAVLGADHNDQERLGKLIEPDNIFMTEILEFAVRLNNPEIECFPGFQPFKLILARATAEAGDETKAMRYVTFINAFVRALPAKTFTVEFKASLKEFERILLERNRKLEHPDKSQLKIANWFT